ncbi:MAG: DUF350 domain-containing protein [Chloroflexi bacterium]|nr:DUF350 domain-containing protein [Chloroflexota bacterium]
MILSLLFSVLGFILLFVGYKILDLLTPEHMGKQIFEEKNVAAAIFGAGFIIGLSIIIAASIHG